MDLLPSPNKTLFFHDFHPHGQDTWTILSGRGEYYLDAAGSRIAIAAGDLAIAPIGCVHDVVNHGDEPLVFISVVLPYRSKA